MEHVVTSLYGHQFNFTVIKYLGLRSRSKVVFKDKVEVKEC